MSIYENKAKGGWRVQVDIGTLPDGRRDRKTVTCKTKKEAQRAELDLLMLKRDLRGHSNRVTFDYFLDTFYLPVKRKALRRNTMRVYESIIDNYLRPCFGSTLVPDIDRLSIQSLISSCSTHKTATNARDTLRGILSEALDMGIIATNPALGRFTYPERPDDGGAKRGGAWLTSFAEHRRLIECAQGDTRAILVLGLCFGLRKGEILGLDWQDIDLDTRQIRIRQTYTVSKGAPDLTAPKTPRSKRIIPMTGFAYRELRAMKGADRRIGPVMVWKGGRMNPRRASRIIETFVRREDVPEVTIMSLRHSFATAAICAGINVAKVSLWLGHTSITTTYNRYVRPMLADLKDDLETIDVAYLAG